MALLRFLNRCSRGRTAWMLLALSALALELTALYFQHVMLLTPCVLCIYQRCALFGVMGAALLGATAPKNAGLRGLAILLWIYSSVEGLRLAWKQTMLQLYPSPFATCDFLVDFPSWLPLDKWLPSVFSASGDCSAIQWTFLNIGMTQWLAGIFAAMLLIGVLTLLSQMVKPYRRRDLFGR